MMMPATRADVILDLSGYKTGDTLIMYNDAPAPMPLFDPRNDQSTDYPDQTAVGGAPSTPAGFGPNTRTIMQIRIGTGGTPGVPFDLASLQAALPQAYGATQDPPIVPESAYNAAFGTTNADTYVRTVDQSINLTGTTQPVAIVMAALPGAGYTVAPNVTFLGGGGTGAAATAGLNGVNSCHSDSHRHRLHKCACCCDCTATCRSDRHSSGKHISRRRYRHRYYQPGFRLCCQSCCYDNRRRRHRGCCSIGSDDRRSWRHHAHKWRLRLHYCTAGLPDRRQRQRRAGSCNARMVLCRSA